MKRVTISILIAVAMLTWLAAPVAAQMARSSDALRVAKNWVSLIIQKRGDWGGSPTAEVTGIQEIMRGNRVLGYFCPVEPVGYVVVSLRKELEPVKVYSDTTNLDPTPDEGMADLIKIGLERILNGVEKRAGPIDSARSDDVEKALEISYRSAWTELDRGAAAFKQQLDSGVILANYQEGQILLTTAWKQGSPYNSQCPSGLPTCTNMLVGCVATAGSQIMRYWYWPPYGNGSPYSDTYDWLNMPNTITGGSPQAQINAVAELCYEVGLAVNMEYGCGVSGSYTYDMEGVYQSQYRYSTICDRKDRPDYTAADWFNTMKADFNANRPIHYRILSHSIVADGWQEIGVGPTRQYHMNYGWGDGYTAWYTLDALYQPDSGGTTDDEYMLDNILPFQYLGSSLDGTYTLPAFPYRYFDRDATCATTATFNEGHYLQSLPNITVNCTSTTGGSIKFYGASGANTRLFTRGDTSWGARIYDGAIKVSENGGLVLR